MNLADISHLATAYGCAGRRGSGKTSRLVRHVADAAPDFLFAFDPTGQLAQKFRVVPTVRPDGILAALGTGRIFWHGSGSEEDFQWFCDVAFAACEHLEGRKLFIVDEVQTWVNHNALPDGFRAMVDKGRWFRLDLAFTCQTFNTLHNGLRNQLTEVAAFAHTDATATRTLLEMGFSSAELADLRRGEYLTRTLDPVGLVHYGDDVRGILRPLPGQESPESPILAGLRAKGAKRTR